MALIIDRYRPKKLGDMSYHIQLSQLLERMVDAGDFPHTIFYGPCGSGKKTRILATLREIYGGGVDKVKAETRSFRQNESSSVTVEVQVIASNYHIEVTPSEVGNKDLVIIQKLIKEISQSPPVDMGDKNKFKVVVIHDADSLSRNAQAALRRTMEKYVANCRLILCCESIGRLIPPIRSRCLCLRVAAPSNDEILKVLFQVGEKEKVRLNEAFLVKLVKSCNRDLCKTLLALDAAMTQHMPLNSEQAVPQLPWELLVQNIVSEMWKEQTPKKLQEVRGKLFDLLTGCIPADVILKALTKQIMIHLDDNDMLKYQTMYWAAYFDNSLRAGSKVCLSHCAQLNTSKSLNTMLLASKNSLRAGSKDIFHLEAFCARFMSILRGFLADQQQAQLSAQMR